MIFGVLLAYFYHPEYVSSQSAAWAICAVAVTCLAASSNYVINEILDAPSDLAHPVKRERPIPAGLVSLELAYVEWAGLGVLALSIAYMINRPFFLSTVALLVMGLIYNVRPIRSKDLPYVDVLTEAINNPIRLMLGWFAVTSSEVPPLSLLIAYWMFGAFLMATKRFSEYRSIGDKAIATAYRKSFKYYDEASLLNSIVFYTTAFGLFLGVFIIRYHLELILAFPLIAGFVCYYLSIAFKDNSAAQSPERLYRERGLVLYLFVCVFVLVILMFIQIPGLYTLFNVEPSRVSPLWKIY